MHATHVWLTNDDLHLFCTSAESCTLSLSLTLCISGTKVLLDGYR